MGKEKGCGVSSVDVRRYTKQIPDYPSVMTLLRQSYQQQIVLRPVLFEPADSQQEGGEVDGVEVNTGCVAAMSFLYTPEYFEQVFHMSGRGHSLTNKFFNSGEITLRRLT